MFKYQVNVYRTSAGTVEVDAETSMKAGEIVRDRIYDLGEFETLKGFDIHSHEYEVDNVEEMFKIDPVTGEKLPMREQGL